MILIISICLTGLISCRKGVPTVDPSSELPAMQQTRIFMQQQTNQALFQGTQGTSLSKSPLLPTYVLTWDIKTPSQQPSDAALATQTSSSTQTFSTNTSIISPTQVRTQNTALPSRTDTQTRTATPVLTSTSTRTPTAQPSSTRTPTHTPSPTLQTGWGGEWIINFEISEGSYTSSILSLTLNGSNFTAQAEIGNKTYEFTGYIYNNETYATGSWTTPTDSGSFWWMLPADGKFAGSWDNHYGFCGKRESASFPDPCKKLPPR